MRKIPGYPGYEIDRQGNVWSVKRGIALTPSLYIGRRGVQNQVSLRRKGKSQKRLVSDLVKLAYGGAK